MQNMDDSFEQEQQNKNYKATLNKISFADDPQSTAIRKYKYNSQSIQPFLFFFKLLCLKPCDKPHRNKLILNIPDTVVFNDKDYPTMWFYTNAKGEVCRLDNVSYYTITNKFIDNALDKELVAVLKKPSYGYGGISGNDIKVVSSCEVKTVLSNVLSSRNEASVIQRFVKTSSVKSSVMRTCWRRNNNHQGWIITSNFQYTSKAKVNEISKFIVNTKHYNTFTAVKCVSEKYLNETLKYVKNIVKFVESHLQTRFQEMVCDFIKDEGGNWWYVNTKAFILEKQDQKVDPKLIANHDCDIVDEENKKKLQTYTKCKKCKYCYRVVADHLITHKLTLLMILQCDQNLIKMGKKYTWLNRCYTQHVGTVNMYVQHKVCDSCYKFYKQVERLIQLQDQLAKLSGISVSEDPKNVVSITAVPKFKGHPPQFGSRLQKVQYDTQMPQGWQLPKDEEIKVELNTSKSMYKRCRFMVFLHGVRDIPNDAIDKECEYFIGYQFLGHVVKFKLNLNNHKQSVENPDNFVDVEINKMKIIYFFVEKRDEIKDFLKNEEIMKVTLYEDEDVLGKIQFELNDFKSDKVLKRDYFKMFEGKNIFPYLSWGMFATLGLHQGPVIETSSLKLSKKNGLLFPENEYHGPDPLPEDWIRMIEEKDDKIQANSQQSISSIKENTQQQKQRQQDEGQQTKKKLMSSLDEEILKYSRESKKVNKKAAQTSTSIKQRRAYY